jgi:hypothetical protein
MASKASNESSNGTLARPNVQASELVVSDVAPLLDAFRGNQRLLELLRVPSSEEVQERLHYDAVPWRQELLSADRSLKIDALASIGDAYLPTSAVTAFVEVILARVRRHVYLKNFKDDRYRNLYHLSARIVAEGKSVAALPNAKSSLKGSCFSLIGPSQMGKTALLQRIRTILGPTFEVRMGRYDSPREHASETPSKMMVIPCLNLSMPKCRTVNGFLSHLRDCLVGEIRDADTPSNALAQLESTSGETMAASACILLNVCLITVDGADFRAVEMDNLEIAEFLVRLQQYTGIPILLSCTSAYSHFLSLSGSLSSNLFGAFSYHLDPIRKPTVGNRELREMSIWYQKVKWYWKMGAFSRTHAMPEELPDWTWEFTQGREGWLSQGFEALHIKLITHPHLLQPGKLTKEEVKKVFDACLRTQAEAVKLAKLQMEDAPIESAPAFCDFLDHFPLEYIRAKGNEQWLSTIGGR